MRFEFDGDRYAAASSHQKQWGARLIAELGLTGNEQILDLGCGDGVLTEQLGQRLPQGRVLGIDASNGMIQTAQTHARSNVSFELMDISDLTFTSEFDVIFSNATLHWVKDHRRLLTNVHRALRANGVLRFNFAADGNCRHFIRVVKDVIRQDAFTASFRQFDWPWYMPDVKEYRSLLSGTPFRDTRVWVEDADQYFPSAEAMIGWIEQPSIVPFLQHLDERDGRRFRDRVVESMLEQTRQADGRYWETFRRINVFARK